MNNLFEFTSSFHNPNIDNINKDLNIIDQLFTDLPEVLESFIKSDNCDLIENIEEINQTTGDKNKYQKLFSQSYAECFHDYDYFIADFRNKIYGKDVTVAKEQHLELRRVGMTGKSLELKTNLLRRLFNRLIELKEKGIKKILDFRLPTVKQAFSNFMKFLNSVLGSLKELFPILESIKEFKETLETANDLIPEGQ